jgi:hypothetical protein
MRLWRAALLLVASAALCLLQSVLEQACLLHKQAGAVLLSSGPFMKVDKHID